MNKTELVTRLTARLDGDRAKAMAAVNGVLEEIEQSLARGEKVSLIGFGTFDRRERAARTARNPATGQSIQVPASVAPVFRAGAGLRQVLADAAGTARSAAVQAAEAVVAVPAVAVRAIAPTGKAAKQDKPKKSSSRSAKASVKAPVKSVSKSSAKDGGKKAKAASGKAAKKSSAKAAKKG